MMTEQDQQIKEILQYLRQMSPHDKSNKDSTHLMSPQQIDFQNGTNSSGDDPESDHSDSDSEASTALSSSGDIPTLITKFHIDDSQQFEAYMSAIKYKAKYQRAKKKKKHCTDVVFKYLMKSAESYKINVLNFHPVPPKRRRWFHDFIDSLNLFLAPYAKPKTSWLTSYHPKNLNLHFCTTWLLLTAAQIEEG